MAVYFPDNNVMFIHFPKTGGCAFYSMIQEQKMDHVNVGDQHDTIDMLGKHYWYHKPKVFLLSREKESWFRSFHIWRCRNPEDNVYAGINDKWQPAWVLEDLFDRDYKTFRENVEKVYPKYYDHIQIKYYAHPTFDMNVLPFEDFSISYKIIFDAIGNHKPIEWFDGFPKINSAK